MADGVPGKVSRRDFLRAGTAVPVALSAAALGVSCGGASPARGSGAARGASGEASGPGRRPSTGEEALGRLMEGNERYASGGAVHPDEGRDRLRRLAEDQHPFAMVIACSDSRVSPELLFDQGVGDLFVVRVIGNIVDQATLGSVEYAVGELGVPLVVMLGHEECGGVTATVEAVEEGGESVPGHILTFADAIYPAVERARRSVGDGPQSELIDESVRENARLGADRIRDDLRFLSPAEGEAEGEGGARVVEAYYNLHDRRVSLL